MKEKKEYIISHGVPPVLETFSSDEDFQKRFQELAEQGKGFKIWAGVPALVGNLEKTEKLWMEVVNAVSSGPVFKAMISKHGGKQLAINIPASEVRKWDLKRGDIVEVAISLRPGVLSRLVYVSDLDDILDDFHEAP